MSTVPQWLLSAGAVWQDDPDVLHHAAILVIENVAVQHEVANVSPILCADGDGDFLRNEQRVFPDAFQVKEFRRRLLREILSVVLDHRQYLKGIDVDMKRVR